GNDAASADLTIVMVGYDVLHSVVSKKLHVAKTELTVQCRGSRQLQLLTCLSTGVVSTRDLYTTEGTSSHGATVVTGKRCTASVHVVDNARGCHRRTRAVGLTATLVAGRTGVLCMTVSGVVIYRVGA